MTPEVLERVKNILHISIEENLELLDKGVLKIQINKLSYIVVDESGKVIENTSRIYEIGQQLEIIRSKVERI